MTTARNLLLLCVAIAAMVLPASAAPPEFRPGPSWHQGADGFERAVEEARRLQRPLFVYFRTDWCPYCKQFEEGLLASKEVKRYVDDIVKVTINPELGPEENRIASTYGVRGFPAIFMHPPVLGEPRQVRRTVMRNGKVGLQTPDEFIETLARAITQ